MSQLVKAKGLTPKGTAPQPTRRSTKRKQLAWWLEHERTVLERRARRLAEDAGAKTTVLWVGRSKE